MTREDVLANVSRWLDSATNPERSDAEFRIRRLGISVDGRGNPLAVQFAIEATAIVAVWTEDIGARVQPASSLSLVPKAH